MKKLLLLCAALALVAAPASASGLLMAWNACSGMALATSSQVFDCDPANEAVHSLYGTFFLDAATPGVVAMDGIIDLSFNGQSNVPAFWHYEGGGCNSTGLGLIDGRPAATICSTANAATTLCAAGGTACDGVITAYGVNYGGPNRARLLFTLARASTDPASLAATTKYFAFEFDFYMIKAGDCAGCATPTSLAWNQAVLYNTAAVGGEGTAAVLSSTDPGSSPSVCSNAPICDNVPVKNKTWGQLKSLYR